MPCNDLADMVDDESIPIWVSQLRRRSQILQHHRREMREKERWLKHHCTSPEPKSRADVHET